ncbi:MAG: protoporphyrinogen oxidase [Candidatus Polarisedimenticolaceae bacterium]|nr:protoporphyrinogen oxidase [Candidatus Polarisedimenticolaceae bacterium]
MNDTDVLIIGGGISGLSTASWLVQQGIEVELWEADARTGGKIRSRQESGYLTEQAAGILMNFRPQVDHLINQLHLNDSKVLRSKTLKRHIIHQGKLTEMPMTIPGMMASPLWSRETKRHLATEWLIPRGREPQESVSAFIERRFGREILEKAIDPFIAGTLASDPDQADAAAVLPRLTALESRYGSITAGILIHKIFKRRRVNNAEAFSFKNGMQSLTDALSESPGIKIRRNHKALAIEPTKNGWRATAATFSGEHTIRCKHLVLCTPADISAQLMAAIDKPISDLLESIEYAPLAIIHYGFDPQQIKHPLNGSGFLIPGGEKYAFNGNLWMSTLFKQRAPDGKVLMTSYLGGARRPEQAHWSDQRLHQALQQNLKQLLGISGEPEYQRIDRHSQGLPLYHGAYQQRMKQLTNKIESWRGLHLAANYLGGVSVRERIFQGLQTADKISLQLCHQQQVQPLNPPDGLLQI